MPEIARQLLALAEELRIPAEVLPPLPAAARTLPDLPLTALTAPETAGEAWTDAMKRLPDWRDDGSFYRWLFKTLDPVPLADLPEDTRLQRAVKAHLAAGGKLGAAGGVRREEAQ